MPSPAERYAAAAARGRRERAEVGRFTAGLDFPLDDFQLRDCDVLGHDHDIRPRPTSRRDDHRLIFIEERGFTDLLQRRVFFDALHVAEPPVRGYVHAESRKTTISGQV